MSRPNFRIIEGVGSANYFPDVDFEQLKRDYLNPDIYVADILKMHKLSMKDYNRLRKKLVEETGVPTKPSNFRGCSHIRKIAKHITQDPLTQKYRVSKYLDGMIKHFGRYRTLDEAMRVRDVLIEHNWDWDFFESEIKPHIFKNKQERDFEDVMKEFREDYLGRMPVAELRKKYGLSAYRYNQLSTSIKHELGLSRKPFYKKVKI